MLARLDRPLAPMGAVKTAEALRRGGSIVAIALEIEPWDKARSRRWTGKRLAWLILVAVIVSAINAIVRKTFDTSSNSWLELQWVLFSIVFLLCSPWTLLDNEHIRIDIVNNLLPKRVRDIHRRRRSRVLPVAAVHRHDHHRRSVLPALL